MPNFLLAVQDDPSFLMPHRYLAICSAHWGRFDEAREVAAKLRTFRRADDREFYLSGLRLAPGETSHPQSSRSPA